ncbi:MAG: PAS domain S-box protein, partial [Gemmatimonadales bacterium]
MQRLLRRIPLHWMVGGPLALLLLLGFLSVGLSLRLTWVQEADAVVLNATGRQRALAQSVLREASLAALPGQGEVRLGRAHDGTHAFRDNLDALATGGWVEGPGAPLLVPGSPSRRYRDVLDRVALEWEGFHDALHRLMETPPGGETWPASLRQLELATDRLAREMEEAVAAYQEMAEARSRFQWGIQLGLLGGGGLVVAVTWMVFLFLVVRPVRRLRLAARSLEWDPEGQGIHRPLLPKEIGEVAEAVEEFRWRMARHAREQETSVRLARTLQPLTDPTAILDSTLEALTEHFGPDGACLVARPAHGSAEEDSVLQRCTGVITPSPTRWRSSWPEETSWQGGEMGPSIVHPPGWTEGEEEHPLVGILAPHWEAGIAESAVIPIRRDGILVLHSRQPGRFAPEDLAFLLLAGDQVAAALLRALRFQEAQEAEARYRTLYHQVPVGLFRCEPRGRILEANRTLAEILGHDAPEALRGVDLRGLWVDPEAGRRWLRSSAGTAESSRTEARIQRKDASSAWIEISVRRCLDEEGNVRWLEGTLRDISLRRQAQERAEILSSAVIQSADAIFVTDREGRIEFVNPAFEEITGYPASQVVGRRPSVLKSGEHPPRFYQELWATILSGRAFKGEFINRRKDGRIFRELKTITPIRDERGDVIHFVSVGRDVTRERELEEQIRRSHQMESVGKLAGGIAHDFNNFLAVINGHAQLILQRLHPGDPSRGDLEGMSQAAHRAGRLVSQLLVFSRQQVLCLEVFHLNDLLGTLEGMLRPLLGERIHLTLDLDPALWAVEFDRHQLEQVVINLAVNAGDAMPHGGSVLVETRNRVLDAEEASGRGVRPGEYVLLGFSDTGGGIPSSVVGRVFDPFFTTKAPGEGTGLGLAMAYGIITQGGGAIWVDSDEGRGTTFSILIPRATRDPIPIPPADTEGVPRRRHPSGALPRGDESILLVEDSAMVRAVTRMMLEEHGYRV